MVEADGSFLVADRANGRVLRFREGGAEGQKGGRGGGNPTRVREAEPARCWPARSFWSGRGFADLRFEGLRVLLLGVGVWDLAGGVWLLVPTVLSTSRTSDGR